MSTGGAPPANVYGHALDSVAIQVPKNELVHVMRTAGRNEIVYLRLDGEEPRPTFLRQVQRNPVTDAILHPDFSQISPRGGGGAGGDGGGGGGRGGGGRMSLSPPKRKGESCDPPRFRYVPSLRPMKS